MKTPTLDFYYFEECPYCQRVIRTIKKLNILVNWNNIHEDSKHMNFLVDATGRRTVPCLFIDGKPMHESLDIIEWLETNESNLTKNK